MFLNGILLFRLARCRFTPAPVDDSFYFLFTFTLQRLHIRAERRTLTLWPLLIAKTSCDKQKSPATWRETHYKAPRANEKHIRSMRKKELNYQRPTTTREVRARERLGL